MENQPDPKQPQSTQPTGTNLSQESQSDIFTKKVLASLKAKLDEKEIGLKIDGNSIEVINKLCKYFLGEKGELGLHKGIFLYGLVGRGKTMIMDSIREAIVGSSNYFPNMNCRTVVNEFNKNGFAGIEKYCNADMIQTTSLGEGGKFKKKHPTFYLFDDLGAEQDGWHYGNKINVISEIILSRYIYFQRVGTKTHITSNLGYDGDEIENRYGVLFRSRIREMFNFVELTGEDKRK